MDLIVEREMSVSQVQRQLSRFLNAATKGAFPFWISNRNQTTHLVIPVDLLPQNLRNQIDDRKQEPSDPVATAPFSEEDAYTSDMDTGDLFVI